MRPSRTPLLGRAVAALVPRVLLVLLASTPGAPARAQQVEQAPPRPLYVSPGADTLALLSETATPEIVEVNGEWVRVRIEGWMRRPEAAPTLEALAPSRTLGLAEIRGDPERYTGQTVRWSVQHIALQRADSLRSDIGEGASYLLVRDPGGEPGFVYVVVPPSLRSQTVNLTPLQRIEIVARVRSGRSPLTGHPILELLELLP